MASLIKQTEKLTDPRVIWGKFLLNLRKGNEQSLHALCVELSNFKIVDRDFVATVSKKINFDSLNKIQNVKKANDIFATLGLGLTLRFVYNPNIAETNDKVKLLSDILGCTVIKK